MNTPDTEWEKEFNQMRKGTGQFIVPTEAVRQFIESLLTSRDTYWKERVEEERMRARQEVQIKQEIGQLGFQVIVATLVNTPVEMERLKSKMAQALKEAIVDNLIR